MNKKDIEDKFVVGTLYCCNNKNQCWFSGDELPPLPRGRSMNVKAYFEIIENKITFIAETKNGEVDKSELDKYGKFVRNNPNSKIKFTAEVIEDEDGK